MLFSYLAPVANCGHVDSDENKSIRNDAFQHSHAPNLREIMLVLLLYSRHKPAIPKLAQRYNIHTTLYIIGMTSESVWLIGCGKSGSFFRLMGPKCSERKC